MRGLRTKLDDLKSAILCSAVRYDILIFVVTWLNQTDPLSLVLFREEGGGGVLIAVRNSLPCLEIQPIRRELEQVFVRAQLLNQHIILGAIYLPPASHPDLYENHVGCIMKIFHNYCDDAFCILGDYNLPHVEWLTVPGSLCSKIPGVSFQKSSATDLLCEDYSYCGLAQANRIVNSRHCLLDLIFLKDLDVVVDNVVDFLILPDPYHPPLRVILNGLFTQAVHNRESVTYLDFTRADYPSIINHPKFYRLGFRV